MIRVLFFLILLAAVAWGIGWIADQPGSVAVTWLGYKAETSVGVGLGLVFLAAVLLNIAWAVVRFVFKLPSLMTLANRARRRAKGYAALSRGMIAAGAGDARTARKSAAEAKKHLQDEPLSLLLNAQSAQLSGDQARAEAVFAQLAQRKDTRLLGLRGLHIEAQRRGDLEAAFHFAHEAHAVAPLPWSAKAVLDHRAANGQWEAALVALESNIKAKLVDKKTGDRQRAVLETAIAIDKADATPDEALRLARAAIGRAPDLVPALALAARLFARKGDLRKAAKIIERAWPRTPHPELAAVYLDLRPGDSNADRLAKAQNLLRLAPRAPESRLAVARAALAARQFDVARDAMKPLISEGNQPTAGICLLMAELENAEHGDQGQVRQWMARAARAPRDAVWMADGMASATWAPASPVTGRLDAYVWQQPPERPAADIAPDTKSDWMLEWVEGRQIAAADYVAPTTQELLGNSHSAEDDAALAPAPVPTADAHAEPVAEAAPETAMTAPSEESASADHEAPRQEPGQEAGQEARGQVKPATGEPTGAANGAVPLQKVVFPLPAPPDDPGLDDTDAPKKRVSFF